MRSGVGVVDAMVVWVEVDGGCELRGEAAAGVPLSLDNLSEKNFLMINKPYFNFQNIEVSSLSRHFHPIQNPNSHLSRIFLHLS
jgi:hypothetical protein